MRDTCGPGNTRPDGTLQYVPRRPWVCLLLPSTLMASPGVRSRVGLRLGVSVEMPAVAANPGDLPRGAWDSVWGWGGVGHTLCSLGPPSLDPSWPEVFCVCVGGSEWGGACPVGVG